MQNTKTKLNWPFPSVPMNLSEKQIRKNEIEMTKQKLDNAKEALI